MGGPAEALFYKLNFEAWLLSSGAPVAIVKPCGLIDGNSFTLLAGHDNTIPHTHEVARADVARVLTYLIENRRAVRMDLCAQPGPATTDLAGLVSSTRWPWQQAAAFTV